MYKTLMSLIALASLCCTASLMAQAQEEDLPVEPPRARGPGGPGGPGGMMRMFPMFAVIDEDENGEISAKELRKAITALKSLDQNEDGKLTEEELRPQFPGGTGGPGSAGRPGGLGRGRPGGQEDPNAPGGQNGQARRDFGAPNPAAMVKRWMEFDADKDGKLSATELTKLAEQFGRPPQRQRPEEGNPGGRRRNQQQPTEEAPTE